MAANAEYRSPLASRYATKAMVSNFADTRRYVLWRRLWVALAEAQRSLGLNISETQIAAMKAHLDDIDLERVAELESRLRHDVMAHVHHFGERVGEGAERIIHLGATSCFVADNAELVMMRDGLELIMDRLYAVLAALRDFSVRHRDLATLAFTHFQPAQLTTVGKRAALWAQDFAYDLESASTLVARIPFRGVKGTTGTQASFLSLFDGDHDKVRQLDRLVSASMGFDHPVPVSGQTYPRKIDSWIVAVLADISASAAKFASDIRLLSHKRELEEPFGSDQVGSSAMAYKRNPMRCERICGLARFVHSLATSPLQTHANQWFERTLDDSANRRLVLTETFLATDAILNLVADVVVGLVVNPAVIGHNLSDELGFMATENVIMAGVRGGHSRQELHERVRQHSHAAALRMKQEGVANDVLTRMAADPLLGPFVPTGPIDPLAYVGRAREQVDEFVAEVLEPLLTRNRVREGRFRPGVRV